MCKTSTALGSSAGATTSTPVTLWRSDRSARSGRPTSPSPTTTTFSFCTALLQDEPGTISRNTGQANQGDSTAALSRDQAVRVVRKYCRSMNRNHPFWYLTALQKTRDFIDYFVLLIGRQLRKHRQRYDFRSDSLGDRKISKL